MQKQLDIYQTFECIHEEVVAKVNAIKKMEIQVQEIYDLIPEKEQQVAALRQEIDELKEQNKEYHETLVQSSLEKKQYEERTSQLNELINILNEKIEKYRSSTDETEYELPEDTKSKLDEKLDQIIQLIVSEYSPSRIDKLIEKRKKLHEASKIIQKEIKKLSKFPKNWKPVDNFNNIAIEECQMRYMPNSNSEFQSLSSIPIPISERLPDLLENSYAPIPAPLQDIDPLKQDINKLIQLQVDQNNFINSSYKTQSEYLKALHDEILEKSLTDQDFQRFEDQFQNQIEQMNELTEISPIQIPEIQISNTGDKSVEILTEKFDQFCKQLEEEHPYQSLTENFINSTENSLNIPPFEEPLAIPYVKRPIPSSDLVRLADSLKDLIKTADRVESLKQIQEKVSLQRRIFEENASKEENDNSSGQSDDETEISQLQFPRPLSPPTENLTAIEFKELVKSKLPEMFHSVVDSTDFCQFVDSSPLQGENSIDVPEDENNISDPINPFQIDGAEPKVSMNADERARVFHDILKDFASFELPPVPHFMPPVPVDLQVKPVDFQPVKDQMSGFLSTSEEDISALLDEIMQLENEAQELSIQLKSELSSNDSDSNFSINEIEDDIRNLEIKKSLVEKEQTQKLASAREISTQIQNYAHEIENLEKRLEEVTITPEMLKEKNEEFNAKEAEILNQYNEKLRKI